MPGYGSDVSGDTLSSAATGFPLTNRVVVRGRVESGTVRSHDEISNRVLVPPEDGDELESLSVDDPNRRIGGTAEESRPIREKLERQDSVG